jgi:mannose-1-phosphate guanylyltransferase
VKAFILAAGFGTRLRPITYTMPKPMVPLCNRPLIAWAVESLLATGVREIIVNLHHFPDVLQRFLTDAYPDVAFHFSVEEEILGTGGGLRRVRPQFDGEEEFYLVNGDTVQFPRWDAMRTARFGTNALAALSLRKPPEGDRFTPVFLEHGFVTGFGKGHGESLMFAGSHVVSTRIFDLLPDRDFSGIVEHAYIPVLADLSEELAGVVDNGLWFDVGTPQRYLAASAGLLEAMFRGKLSVPSGSRLDRDSLLHSSASGVVARSTVGARSVVEGDVRESIVWEDCRIARGVVVERCIVGSGVSLTEGSYRDAVIVLDDPRIPLEYERVGPFVVKRD